MIVLKDLLVKENKIVPTEDGNAEVQGGLFAEFTIDEQDNFLVPINTETYNAFLEMMAPEKAEFNNG